MTIDPRQTMRICTAGSVDDGKSTLIGRLLWEVEAIYSDQVQTVKKSSGENIDYALFTDGLKSEREQSITIDVAYRYFSSKKRHFILADTPGHTQYTRNMATGASLADLAILVIDAKKGLSEQSQRHALILSLLGVKRLCVAINKMDLVHFSQDRFLSLKQEFSEFAKKLDITEIYFIPTSALLGDNITQNSQNMDWYQGQNLLSFVENAFFAADSNLIDFRYYVQYHLRPHQDFRGYCGSISSGSIKTGDAVKIYPSQQETKVRSIYIGDKEIQQASSPLAITLCFDDEIDIDRGDLIVKKNNTPQMSSSIESMLIWFDQEELDLQKKYLLKIGTKTVHTHITNLHYRLNIKNLHKEESTTLGINDIGRAHLQCDTPLYWDTYKNNKQTGSFILIDSLSNRTVAAGLIIDRDPQQQLSKKKGQKQTNQEPQNISLSQSKIDLKQWKEKWSYNPQTIWLTGLPASGKSTLSNHLEQALFQLNHQSIRLDGDNLRFGLNRNLGFSEQDREENVRRTAESAKLLNQAGVTVIVSLISPIEKGRKMARSIIGKENFIEVFIDTPIETCKKRDPKGLYKKAEMGLVQQFTGVDSPYEPPSQPDIHISCEDIEENTKSILDFYLQRSKK